MAGLGAEPTLVTSLAEDEGSKQIELRLRGEGVEIVAPCSRRQIVAKHRYVVDHTKLFKVDEGSTSPLDSRSEQVLGDRILEAADGAAVVIFSDFGYGLITEGLLDRILKPLRASVPVLTADVSGRQTNLLRFKSIDLLCPTEREMRENAARLFQRIGCGGVEPAAGDGREAGDDHDGKRRIDHFRSASRNRRAIAQRICAGPFHACDRSAGMRGCIAGNGKPRPGSRRIAAGGRVAGKSGGCRRVAKAWKSSGVGRTIALENIAHGDTGPRGPSRVVVE